MIKNTDATVPGSQTVAHGRTGRIAFTANNRIASSTIAPDARARPL
jgi:hypothetical protein